MKNDVGIHFLFDIFDIYVVSKCTPFLVPTFGGVYCFFISVGTIINLLPSIYHFHHPSFLPPTAPPIIPTANPPNLTLPHRLNPHLSFMPLKPPLTIQPNTIINEQNPQYIYTRKWTHINVTAQRADGIKIRSSSGRGLSNSICTECLERAV